MIRNVVANVAAKAWTVLSVLIFVPFYIKILGFESFSVISFTLVIAGIFVVIDGGLTATLSREMARGDIGHDDKRRTVRTLERVYVGIATLGTVALVALAGHIAREWASPTNLPAEVLVTCCRLVAVDIGAQLLFRFYIGGLLGLEKQVSANLMQIAYGAVRSGLVLPAIIWNPSLLVFFGWQAGTSVVFLVAVRRVLLRQFGAAPIVRGTGWLDYEVIRRTWRFAFGMLLMSCVAALNTQLDKLVISKYLPLQTLGYYTLAVTLAGSMLALVSPITTAASPRFTLLTSSGLHGEVASLYGTIGRAIGTVLFPVASLLIFLPYEVLYAWTGDQQIASAARPYLVPLAVAYAALSVTALPYCIAVANGNTKINNALGLASLLFTVPGYVVGVRTFGGLGAALVFCATQVAFAFVYMVIIDRKYLRLGASQILIRQVLWPWLICIAATYCASRLVAAPQDRWTALITVVVVASLVAAMTAGLIIRRSDFKVALGR